jgi:hypothetical protein
MEYFKSLIFENQIIAIPVILWIILAIISIYFCFKVFKPVIDAK